MAHASRPSPGARRPLAVVTAVLIVAALAGGGALLLSGDDDGPRDAGPAAETGARTTATGAAPEARAQTAPSATAPLSAEPSATEPSASAPSAGEPPSATEPSATAPSAGPPTATFLEATESTVALARPAYARSGDLLAGMRAKTYDPTRARPAASFAIARHGAALGRARQLAARSPAERETRALLTAALELAVAHDRDVLAVVELYGTEAVGPFAAATRRAEASAAAAAEARTAFVAALDRLRAAAGRRRAGSGAL